MVVGRLSRCTALIPRHADLSFVSMCNLWSVLDFVRSAFPSSMHGQRMRERGVILVPERVALGERRRRVRTPPCSGAAQGSGRSGRGRGPAAMYKCWSPWCASKSRGTATRLDRRAFHRLWSFFSTARRVFARAGSGARAAARRAELRRVYIWYVCYEFDSAARLQTRRVTSCSSSGYCVT